MTNSMRINEIILSYENTIFIVILPKLLNSERKFMIKFLLNTFWRW